MVTQNSTNNYSVASFIVGGNYSTIAAAIAAASSGDTIFIKPGTYTENPTLQAGVNLCAFDGDQTTPNVIINGKCTFTGAGTVSISNIQLQTNSDYFLAVTGSSASVVYLDNCNLNCLNNTGIDYTSSNSSSLIHVNYCYTNTATTGIALFNHSSSGGIIMLYTQTGNTGSSTTASTVSSGGFVAEYCTMQTPIAFSSAAVGVFYSVVNDVSAEAVNAISLTGTSNVTCRGSQLLSGTASAVSVGAGTNFAFYDGSINSTNTNAFTGAGTITYGGVVFSQSSGINVTTQNPVAYSVPQGGTGNTSIAAYALVAGGTTSGGPLQVVSGLGTAGQVLTSNGAAALPGWANGSDFTYAYTNVNTSPYTVLTTDEYLSVDCSGGAISLHFPNAPTAKQTWIIKDRTGSAATNHITLTTPGGTVTFDGSTSYVIDGNYQAVNLLANATPTYEIY